MHKTYHTRAVYLVARCAITLSHLRGYNYSCARISPKIGTEMNCMLSARSPVHGRQVDRKRTVPRGSRWFLWRTASGRFALPGRTNMASRVRRWRMSALFEHVQVTRTSIGVTSAPKINPTPLWFTFAHIVLTTRNLSQVYCFSQLRHLLQCFLQL